MSAAKNPADARQRVMQHPQVQAWWRAMDCGFHQVADVFEECLSEALTFFSQQEMDDYVAAARILCKYADANKGFGIKAGFVDGGVIDEKSVQELAKLPSREELVVRALGGLNAPISGFVGVLHANLRSLVIALNVVAEKSA